MKKEVKEFIILSKGFKNRQKDSYLFKFKTIKTPIIYNNTYKVDISKSSTHLDYNYLKINTKKNYNTLFFKNIFYFEFLKLFFSFNPKKEGSFLNYLFFKKDSNSGVLNITNQPNSLFIPNKDGEGLSPEFLKAYSENFPLWESDNYCTNKILSTTNLKGDFEWRKGRGVFLIRDDLSKSLVKSEFLYLSRKDLINSNRNYINSKGFYYTKLSERSKFDIFFLINRVTKDNLISTSQFFNNIEWFKNPIRGFGINLEDIFDLFFVSSNKRFSYFNIGKNHLLNYTRYGKRILDRVKLQEIKGPKKSFYERGESEVEEISDENIDL